MHLYIHIPFCKQKCTYCNFHFSTNLTYREEMISSIIKELELRQHEIDNPLETIYLGGGTPSILNAKEIHSIFKEIEKKIEIKNNAEITLEANPDDLNQQKINELKDSPINRLSIGVQSFYNEDLNFMNRAHNAQEADASIKRSQDAGFVNITIDLIYGSPTTTQKIWQNNVQKALELQVPHISSYALTVEPKTLLQHQIQLGKVSDIDENVQQEQFNFLVNELTNNGFDHYEISNFGKPNFYSQHNSAYWKGKPYIGIGPSAHSYNGKLRSWNISQNQQYISAISNKKIPNEVEILSEKDILNEMTMIGLRTMYGIDLVALKSKIQEELFLEWKENVDKLVTEQKLIEKDGKIFLNTAFRFFADGIASQLFIV